MVGETVSDRHKISLAEDSSRIFNEEDDCRDAKCAAKINSSSHEVNLLSVVEDDCSELQHPLDSDESYDSEDMMDKGTTAVMAIRESENLLPAERESLVNMGENTTKLNIREIKRMRQEIVDPKVGMKTPD